MQIPVERWYSAITERHSRRQFLSQSLTGEHLDNIRDFITAINKSFQDVRAELVTEKPDQVFKGAIGSYGKIKGASAYIAFIGKVDKPYVQELIGYMGESVILEATSLGVATCWVGGFFKPEIAAQQIVLENTEKIFAVTPLGYAQRTYSFQEKMLSGLVKSSNRKDLAVMTTGLVEKEWPPWVRSALEMARLSPSAVNRQPWLFTIESGAIKVGVDDPQDTYHISKRLDCGIAMLHLEIGARYTGVKGIWEHLPAPDVARFKVEK